MTKTEDHPRQGWPAQAGAQGPNGVLSQMNLAGATRTTYVPDILGSVIATFDAMGALSRSIP